MIASHLRKVEGGSAERALVRYLTETVSDDSGNYASMLTPPGLC
ncbi:hypothetical protein P3102_34045 [Amycolatopsis sp. QT-25]|nr:hypothetical protein [Amycolatopsis sp. QT-25]WET79004.1 hypothetical protein P3102_34045 [Amycolatopsis sp. QT-25]